MEAIFWELNMCLPLHIRDLLLFKVDFIITVIIPFYRWGS